MKMWYANLTSNNNIGILLETFAAILLHVHPFKIMVTGEDGLTFLDVLIHVAEVHDTVYECVTIPVRALVAIGVLAMQLTFITVTHNHVQVIRRKFHIF